MSMHRVIGGEGASVPWLRVESGSAPGLVLCPMLPSNAATAVGTVQEIYRLAYERAQAALRPSAYDIARTACWN